MAIIGNYEIIRQIGEGGFGVTYEARHVIRPKIKACLKQHINLTAEDIELLGKEADLLAELHHHSLPTFRDYYRANDGSYVLAMSFIEGKTLEQSVKKHKAIDPEDVCWVTQRTLNALYYLHSQGIIHGDVKPNNIIVQPQKHNAVLVDYGLSFIKPRADSSVIGYTEIFAAPEIQVGKPPLPESDLYSLGLTMTYALGGDPAIKQIPNHVPAKLKEFYHELMRPDPLDRPKWEKEDLVKKLSDVRQEVFGRRFSSHKWTEK
ncbi:MAG TPA: serine/threonine-protein kinase [Candidatus Nanoarchaeia archaeon]|nr:serine/threonine-protein kinase [Candidatus Nanoarchaeia archaeon]